MTCRYLEGRLAEHVVLRVAKGLARGNHDRVPGVHPQRVEVLYAEGRNRPVHKAASKTKQTNGSRGQGVKGAPPRDTIQQDMPM